MQGLGGPLGALGFRVEGLGLRVSRGLGLGGLEFRCLGVRGLGFAVLVFRVDGYCVLVLAVSFLKDPTDSSTFLK